MCGRIDLCSTCFQLVMRKERSETEQTLEYTKTDRIHCSIQTNHTHHTRLRASKCVELQPKP